MLKEKITMYFNNRNLVLKTLLVFTMIIFIFRLIDLQIINGSSYREMSQKKMMRTVAIEAPRGTIVDRNGIVLASSKIGYDVVIYKTDITNEKLNEILLKVYSIITKNKDNVISNLPMSESGFTLDSNSNEFKEFLDIYSFDENISFENAYANLCTRYELDTQIYSLAEKLSILSLRYEIGKNGYSLFNYVTLAKNVSYETMVCIEEIKNDLGGITILSMPKRYYVYGESLAHVLGYVSSISSEEYENLKNDGYSQNSIIGKNGIELFLEEYLKGENGILRSEVDSMGQVTYEYTYKEATSGQDVALTIDYRLQKIAEDALKNKIIEMRNEEGGKYTEASAGAVVILDVNSGEVLAMVSYPTFDPNIFISGISYNDWNNLNNDENLPMYNRSTQGTYAPGSTFKMISAIAGLETGNITSTELIKDTGLYEYSYHPACWIYTDYGMTHGSINVAEAIKVSCNCYFYEVGRRVGITTLVKYATMFGLGQKTGIEIAESTGTIAGTQDVDWYLGDTLSAAIGQSYNAFTPIQLANYIATLANGGTKYTPTLIKSVGTGSNTLSKSNLNEYIKEKTGIGKTIEKLDIKKENLDVAVEGMKKSTMEVGGGSYYIFGVNDVQIAGKTGTAEVADGASNGMFGGFAPVDNPEIAIVVVIEHGGTGLNSARVAKTIVEEYYNIKNEEDSVKSSQDMLEQKISF